jgi:Transposase IS116/IS110/IS902 family./Transposase.
MMQNEIRVSVDVGCRRHAVAIGLSTGEVVDEFEIVHEAAGFRTFFQRIEALEHRYSWPVAVAMEGYNGYARPLDRLVRARNYNLYNINNLKLARFKEIFPAAAKTDAIDARKGLELFQLRDHLPLAKDVLQAVAVTPGVNEQLKRLTRRRRSLVNERIGVMNRLQSDLQAVCPGLLDITKDVSNIWFIHFLASSRDLRKLAGKRRSSLLKIRGVGSKYADIIECWQRTAFFSDEVDLVNPMVHEDAQRIMELNDKIKQLDRQNEALHVNSDLAKRIRSLPGFGKTCCAELAGEIGTIERFAGEASLALYLGMATLDNSSGNYKGSKVPRHVNTRAKAAMMVAVDRHRKCVEQSARYYEKKRQEGKTHNQAIRALGRQLCRVMFRMLKNNRDYENSK